MNGNSCSTEDNEGLSGTAMVIKEMNYCHESDWPKKNDGWIWKDLTIALFS